MQIAFGCFAACTIGVIAIQWVIIWRLLDRLLIQAHIRELGPVHLPSPIAKTEPAEPPKPRKIFSLKIPD